MRRGAAQQSRAAKALAIADGAVIREVSLLQRDLLPLFRYSKAHSQQHPEIARGEKGGRESSLG